MILVKIFHLGRQVGMGSMVGFVQRLHPDDIRRR
jgi:hypothetical protein